MSTESHEPDFGLDARQRAAREAVRALGAVEPDPGFRARLRENFVTGHFDGISPVATVTEGERPRRIRRARRRWVGMAVRGAIAATLAFVLITLNTGPQWQVVAVEGTDRIMVDGRWMDCDDLSPVQAALHPGCRIRLPQEGALELAGADQLRLRLEGEGEMTVPGTAGRWFGRSLESTMKGPARMWLATGPGFVGAEYSVKTEQAAIHLRGSALRIVQGAQGVRVDVLEGRVHAVDGEGSEHTVVGGRSLWIGVDGSRESALDPDVAAFLDSWRRSSRPGPTS